eukprot:scaffold42802_cov31-Tisochrysis_lutea.AAC.4
MPQTCGGILKPSHSGGFDLPGTQEGGRWSCNKSAQPAPCSRPDVVHKGPPPETSKQQRQRTKKWSEGSVFFAVERKQPIAFKEGLSDNAEARGQGVAKTTARRGRAPLTNPSQHITLMACELGSTSKHCAARRRAMLRHANMH